MPVRSPAELLAEGFAGLPELERWLDRSLSPAAAAVLEAAAERLQDNFPYFHPLYAGQMLKPPHPVARHAYALAMLVNPNNHALDGGRASSAMEKECVAELAALFGWDEHLGHLTSGGTMANLEALWVAGQLAPGSTILASDQAHYTHARISAVLGLPFEAVGSDARGRLDPGRLEARLAAGGVGTVVATAGTTGVGAVDPIPEILALAGQFGCRVHVDAAYGGYFVLAGNLAPETRAALDAISRADSVVIDPHKHGLQPYGCGSVLFRDPAVGRFYRHDSPYTYFSSDELHLGEISLECSRAGAAAVALWATHQLLPPVAGGEFGRDLGRCRAAAVTLHERLAADPRFLTVMAPELDIVVWAPAVDGDDAMSRGGSRPGAAISAASQSTFAAAAARDLHLALIELPGALLEAHWPHVHLDRGETVTCLRSVLMKPEHLDWIDRIWEILNAVAERG